MFSTPVFEKINLSQQFDFGIGYLGSVSKLFQNTGTILGIAKKVKEVRIEDSICSLSDQTSVNVVRVDLNVDWKFENSLHKLKLKVAVFVLKELVREVNTTTEQPSLFTWVMVRNSKINSLC